MLSLRDPLRDTLEFHKFALGVFLGCLLLVLPALKAVRLSAALGLVLHAAVRRRSRCSGCCWRSARARRATTPR